MSYAHALGVLLCREEKRRRAVSMERGAARHVPSAVTQLPLRSWVPCTKNFVIADVPHTVLVLAPPRAIVRSARYRARLLLRVERCEERSFVHHINLRIVLPIQPLCALHKVHDVTDLRNDTEKSIYKSIILVKYSVINNKTNSKK